MEPTSFLKALEYSVHGLTIIYVLTLLLNYQIISHLDSAMLLWAPVSFVFEYIMLISLECISRSRSKDPGL